MSWFSKKDNEADYQEARRAYLAVEEWHCPETAEGSEVNDAYADLCGRIDRAVSADRRLTKAQADRLGSELGEW